jgi:hypothetical protein
MVEEIINIVKEWLNDCSPGFLYRLGKGIALDSEYDSLEKKIEEYYASRSYKDSHE